MEGRILRTILRRDREGFSLLEVIVASSILAITMVALVSALISGMRLREMNRDKALARNEAERVLSALRGMPTIFDAYSRFGAGGVEETFDVYGLAGPPGEQVGRVIFWRRKDGNPPDPDSTYVWTAADLAEAQGRVGMPFPLPLVGAESALGQDYLDTDGSFTFDGLDQPSIIPVTVRIRWMSRGRAQTEYFSTVIGIR